MRAPTGPSERATAENWMYPPWGGWTTSQVQDLWLPFDWEMLDGVIAVRPLTTYWHDHVRHQLLAALADARRGPLEVGSRGWVAVNDRTLLVPDVVVRLAREDGLGAPAVTPVSDIVLAVEVVAPESRTEDRYRKPGLLSAAGVAHYWRVERGEDGLPVVHEYSGDGSSGWERWTEHRGTLATAKPYPVEITLRRLIDH